MNLNEWAIYWGVPFEAVEDLRRIFGTIDNTVKPQNGESEAAIQTRIRLESSKKGIMLMRNNVGVLTNTNGVPIRYGLMNESKQLNSKFKSSDLIGIRPIRIEPEYVGRLIGQFVARECKKENWEYAATKEEIAQLKFLELVMSYGGDAAFANKEGTL